MPGFDKSVRLRKRAEFTDLTEKGLKISLPNFIIVKAVSERSLARLGITVSRKVGNAVTRNRIKRLVREFFRNNSELFLPSDYNIIARSGAVNQGFAAVCQELANGISRIGRQISY